MSILRGVDSFDRLWQRRTTIADDAGNAYELLSLADIVKAKKTQRDKDWPMVTRLLEAIYPENKDASTQEQVGLLASRDAHAEILDRHRPAISICRD
jgi:hypothetical protein